MFTPVYFEFCPKSSASALDNAFAAHIPNIVMGETLTMGIGIKDLGYDLVGTELEKKYKLLGAHEATENTTGTTFENFANIIYVLWNVNAAFGTDITSMITNYCFLIKLCQNLLDTNISNKEREVVTKLYEQAIDKYTSSVIASYPTEPEFNVELIYDNIFTQMCEDDEAGAIWINLKDEWDGDTLTSRITSTINAFIPYDTVSDHEDLFAGDSITKPVFELDFLPESKALDSCEILQLMNSRIRDYGFARYKDFYYELR